MKTRLLILLIAFLVGAIFVPEQLIGQSSSKSFPKDLLKVNGRKTSRPSKTRHIENNTHKKKTKAMAKQNKRQMVECPTFASYSTKTKVQREKSLRKKS